MADWGRRCGGVASVVLARVIIAAGWESNDIQIMEEDPEYLLRDIHNLFAPHSVWTGTMHIEDKADRSLRLAGLGVFEI